MASATLAYLYSRFPVVSQTFCDTEMLAMEQLGQKLVVGSINPPPSSFRHTHLARLKAEVLYPAPPAILKLWEDHAKEREVWPKEVIAAQEAAFGKETKPGQRARNALYFAREFLRRDVRHVHVHFTNRAAHTALFIKALTGIPFSVTAHAQDFMVDLGSRELLREMLLQAEFTIAVSDFSRGLLVEICPEAADSIHRVYNGQDPASWPVPLIPAPQEVSPPLILSVGRLIEFKGFHVLIQACEILRNQGLEFRCGIAGEGPWRERLEGEIAMRKLANHVHLLGVVNQDTVREKLRQCAIFALPSLVDEKGAMDILPTVILEAMAAGKPVVSTRLAGIPEMVQDGQTGLLVPPADEKALAEALAVMLRDRVKRAESGRAGRERFEQHFTTLQTAPGLLAKFQASLAAERVPSPEQEKCRESVGISEGAAPVSAGKRLVYWVPAPPQAADDLLALLLELCLVRKHCSEQSLRLSVLWGSFPASLPAIPEEHAAAIRKLLRESRYAPDALVQEAAWQADRQGALKLETHRQALGPAVSTVDFLEQARLLQGWLGTQLDLLPGHWHTVGSEGLLSGWLARRAGYTTAHTWSATLPAAGYDTPRSMLKELAEGIAGGRTGDEKMLEDLSGKGGAWLEDALTPALAELIKPVQGISKFLDAFGTKAGESTRTKYANECARVWNEAIVDLAKHSGERAP